MNQSYFYLTLPSPKFAPFVDKNNQPLKITIPDLDDDFLNNFKTPIQLPKVKECPKINRNKNNTFLNTKNTTNKNSINKDNINMNNMKCNNIYHELNYDYSETIDGCIHNKYFFLFFKKIF